MTRRADAPSVVEGADRYVLPVRGPARFAPVVLSGAAAFIWEELAEPSSSAELVARVAEHYGIPEAETGPAVAAFLDGLGEMGLLEDGPPEGASEDAVPEGQTPETGAPETGAPETGAPETGAPDFASPDTGAFDTETPDNMAPDSASPDRL